MATKTVHLTIPTPCQQRWQDMIADGTGRFCASCQKTVVDFSSLTDQQVVSLLAQQNGSGCGRFRANQLDRAVFVTAPVSHSPVRLLSWLLAGVMGYQTVNANTLPTETKAIHATDNKPASALPPKIDQPPPTDSVRVITGRVVEQGANATNAGIPGASVLIKGTTTGATTDAEGKFQVNIPANYYDKAVTLQISWIGYKTAEIQTSPDQSTPLVVALEEDQNILMGEVVVIGSYKKLTFFQRLRNRLRATH